MRVLLHTCCGPCASYCIQKLRELGYEPVLFYSNANIYPHREFKRRLEAARTLALRENVPLVVDAPDHGAWRNQVAKGFENAPEGGARCERCFQYSLTRTLQAIEENHCEAFTTSLTVSPYKNSQTIFSVGSRLCGEKFLPVNFKKENGYQKSIALASAYGLYRQSYCGCEFSKPSLFQRLKKIFSNRKRRK